MGLKCDAAIQQLFSWDLSPEGDPEPASSVGQGLEEQAAPLNVPLAGALTSHQDIQQLLHFRLHSEVCWLPVEQLHAGSQSGALLLWDALRMGFDSISASAEVGTAWMCLISPALNRVIAAFVVQPQIPSKEGKRRGEIMWQTEQGWAESWAGRRAARHSSRLARCAPLPWLAPHSLGGKFPFCEGILGPREAGRAASTPGHPSQAGSSTWSPGGRTT